MPSKSPTARTLDECRRLGWEAGVVECHNTFSNKKRDLFGCIDVVALTGEMTLTPYNDYMVVMDGAILGIQATSASNHAARVTKAKAEPRLKLWLEAGGRMEVWSWRKHAKKVDGKYWRVRRQAVTLADLNGKDE